MTYPPCAYHPNNRSIYTCGRCRKSICANCAVSMQYGTRCARCMHITRYGEDRTQRQRDRGGHRGNILLSLFSIPIIGRWILLLIFGGILWIGISVVNVFDGVIPDNPSSTTTKPNREPTRYYATAIVRNESRQTEAIIPAASNSAPAPNMDATAQARAIAARPTMTPTPIPTATSTPTPIEITLADLLIEYEQNKVLADIHYRYRQNGKAPIRTEAYIDEVSDIYFTMLPRADSSWQEEIDCYYADTRAALHIQKGQRVKITARVIGKR